MKKLTLMLITTLMAVVAFGQKPTSVTPDLSGLSASPKAVKTSVRNMDAPKGKFSQRTGVKAAKSNAPRKVEIWESSTMITEVPQTAEVKTYTRSGSYYNQESSYAVTQQSGPATIAFDGDDVYILDPVMGLSSGCWVKGTKSGNTITVPLGQILQWDSSWEYGYYLTMANVSGSSATVDEETSEVTYTIEADGIHLNGTSASHVLTVAWTDEGTAWKYRSPGGEYETVFKEGFTAPDLVEIPAGLNYVALPMTATEYGEVSGLAYSTTVNVGFDGSDVYIQGLNKYVPEAWVKGTLSEGVVTVPIQYVGSVSEGTYLYLTGYNSSSGGLADITFDYDADDNTFTANTLVIINNGNTSLNFNAYYSGMFIGETPEAVTPPEGLETKELPITGRSYYNSQWNDVSSTVNVGFDGNDVYIQGLLSTVPEGWVKGSKSGDKLVFPLGQYVGKTSGGSNMFAVGYDQNTGDVADFTFTVYGDDLYISDGLIFENGKKNEVYYYRYYANGLTIGTDVEPEVVTLPEGLEAEALPFTGTNHDGSAIADGTTINVAVDGSDVYMQGFETYANGWIKGNADKGVVTFTYPQKFGTFTYGSTDYDFYMLGADADSKIANVTMKYSALCGYVMTSDLVVSGEKRSFYYYNWYAAGSRIGAQKEVNTFNFNSLGAEFPYSSNDTNDGDIIADFVATNEDGVTLTVSTSTTNVANRFWNTNKGPQLRIYGGTMTFEAPEGETISKIVFNNAKWNAGNSADSGEFNGNTWTGDAQTVVVTIAANTQLNSIDVSFKEQVNIYDVMSITPAEGEVESLQSFVITFEGAEVTVNEDAIPTLNQLDGGIAMGTTASTVTIDFDQAVTEPGDYTLDIPAGAILYQGVGLDPLQFHYTIKGEDKPDYTIDPAEGEVDALQSFTITFNNYMVEVNEDGDLPVLFNVETEEEFEASDMFDVAGKSVMIMFDQPITTAGEYMLLIMDGSIKKMDGSFLPEMEFTYTVTGAGKPEVVTLPEGAEAEEYSFKGYTRDGEEVESTVNVAFVGDEVYMQGLAWDDDLYDMSEAWVKGTLEEGALSIPETYLGELKMEEADFSIDMKLAGAWFEYDAETNTFTSPNGYGVLMNMAGMGYEEVVYYSNVVITKAAAEIDNPIVWVAADQGYENAQELGTEKLEPTGTYTATFEKAESANVPKYYDKGTDARLYMGGKLTIAGPDMWKIIITCTPTYYGNMTSDPEGLKVDEENSVLTWKGRADEVVFTNNTDVNRQLRIKQIEVYYGEDTDPQVNIYDLLTIDPADHSTVDALQNFMITFGGEVVSVNEDALLTLTNTTTEEVFDAGIEASADGKTVYIDVAETVADAGTYRLVIPTGAISYNGEALDELSFVYTILGEEYTIDPAEGEVESLGTFNITFNNYGIELNGEPEATLTNNTTGTTATATIMEIAGKRLFISFDETTTPGEYTLTIPEKSVRNSILYEFIPELTFNYTIPGNVEEDVLVEVPEGVEIEEWSIDAIYRYATNTGWGTLNIQDKTGVAIDGDDIYVQGLAYFFPEAWVKGTIKGDQAIFASGQFVGEDEYGTEYLVGTADNGATTCDYVLTWDAEARKLTLASGYLIVESDEKDEVAAYGYWQSLEIFDGEIVLPEPVVAPENLKTMDYTFKAEEVEYDEEGNYDTKEYTSDLKIGFDGNDVYVQGICSAYYLPDAWIKGTRDGNTVTFETGQFFGTVYDQYDIFFVGYGDNGLEDFEMTYNETTGNFKVNNDTWILINSMKNSISYYTIYADAEFVKVVPTTGISTFDADEDGSVYYDALGRRTTGKAKGLLIKQTRQADGTVTTQKVARK